MTLPDVVTALRVFLAQDTAVTTARTVGGVLGSMGRAQGPNVVYPLLRVYRAGGPAEDNYLDRPLVQFEAIGAPNDWSDTTDKVLVNLLRVVQSAVYSRVRNATSNGVRFTAVDTLTQAQWAPDTETNQSRYFTRLALTCHGA